MRDVYCEGVDVNQEKAEDFEYPQRARELRYVEAAFYLGLYRQMAVYAIMDDGEEHLGHLVILLTLFPSLRWSEVMISCKDNFADDLFIAKLCLHVKYIREVCGSPEPSLARRHAWFRMGILNEKFQNLEQSKRTNPNPLQIGDHRGKEDRSKTSL
jgi:hypothetical protein